MPRLLALSVCLLIFSAVLVRDTTYRSLDMSVLRLSVFPVLLGYALVTAGSMAFALNSRESFFDLLKTVAFVVVAAFASILFVSTDKWQERTARLAIIAAWIACLNGFSQYYTRVVLPGHTFLPDGRKVIYAVNGFMAHKNLFSLSLMMAIPFVAFGACRLKQAWRLAGGAALIMILALIVLLQTRAAWVGLAVSTVASVGLLIISGKHFNVSDRWRYALAAICLATVGAGAAVIGSGERTHQNAYIAQLKSIADPLSGQNIHRLRIWSSTLDMIKDHPLTGVGAGNWKLHSAQYNHGRFQAQDQLNWGQPHNDYLWVCAEKGIGGLLLFLAIFACTIFYLSSVISERSSSPGNRLLALLLLGGLLGYMTAAFFDFPYDHIHHQASLAIMIAGAAALRQAMMPPRPFRPHRLLVLAPVVVSCTFGSVYSYSALKQELHIKKAMTASKRNDWRESLREAQLAGTSFRTHEPIGYPVVYFAGLAHLRLKDYPNAIRALERALPQDPYNFAVLSSLSQAYFENGQIEESKECFARLLTVLPLDPNTLKNLSIVYRHSGEYRKAYESLMLIPDQRRDPEVIGTLAALKQQLGLGQ